METLLELEGKIGHEREALKTVMDEAREGSGNELRYNHENVKAEKFASGGSMVEWIQGKEKALADLEGKATGLRAIAAADQRNAQALAAGVKSPTFPADDGKGSQGDVAPKSFGDMFVEKFYDDGGAMKGDVARNRDYLVDTAVKGNGSVEQMLKTDMTTAAGWAPENIRIGRVQLSAQRPIAVADLFPVIPTTQAAVVYMLESTFTNNAAETAENAAIPENAFALTPTTLTVRKFAATLPVTEEQLADVEQVRAYIDQRMRYALLARLDSQLLQGDGSGVTVEGLANVTGIQSVALSNEIPETIHQVITDIRANAFSEPDEVIIHPTDWDQVATLKDSAGNYIYSHPSKTTPNTLWGKPVTLTTAGGAAGNGYVGAFAAQSALFMRQGIEVAITDSHASEFLDDVMRLKFTLRGVPAFFRPAAFGEATGI